MKKRTQKGQDADLRTSESDWRQERDPRSWGEKRENATQMRHPVPTGVTDCQYYLKGACFFGQSCRFNHPPRTHETVQQPSAYPVRPGARNCVRYLQTGQCGYGSKCWFNHPPVRREMVKRSSPYPVHLGVRLCEQYLNTGQCSYGRKCRFNHPPTHFAPVLLGQNSWLQRRRAQKNVQSEEERTLRERKAHDLDEQKQRERVEEKLRFDQIKATVQSDERGIQTEHRLEIAEYHSANGQENLQEQANMESQKREGEAKAKDERSRSLTDNVDQFRQLLQGIGIERKEADGV